MTFLSRLWRDPDRDGCITIWFAPSKFSFHFPVRSLPLSDDDLRELREDADQQGEHVYFGLGLRREGLTGDQQGGKKDIRALPGFALDIDFLDPKAHKATNLPRDIDDAAVIIEPGPQPTLIVHTGNGVHVYYLFRRPLQIHTGNLRAVNTAYEAFQRPFIERAKEHGYHVDLTATVNRVWRLPGFLNRKTGKEVELIFDDMNALYEHADLGVTSAPSPAPSSSASVVASPTASRPSYELVDLDVIANMLGKTQNRYKAQITEALAGRSPAPRGARDEVLQGICSTIAWLPEARNADPRQLAEVLRPALAVWAAEPDAELSIDDELEKAADKIERSQDDWRQQQAHRQPAIDALARHAGLAPSQPAALVERHAIIQKRSNFYVFDFRHDRYSHLLTKEELEGYLDQAWEHGPFDLYWPTKDGGQKKRSIVSILNEHRTVAKEIIGDLARDKSYYDATEETFYEAVAIPRVTEPRFDSDVDTWLRLLVGPASLTDGTPAIDRLLDWIAGVPQLHEQCCVLYLEGVSGAGKGLLANGLSRIWTTGGPTPFANIISDYNSEILECPFVFADEGIPHRKGNVSVELRSLVGSSKITINEKYVVHRKVNGSTRLMLAANNDEALMFGNENLSIHDLEAITGRFLHIHAQRDAADWLKAKNVGGHMTRGWIEGDLLARHCLHLAKTRQIKRGKRFLVEGDETVMHRKLVLQGGVDSLVHEWLVRFATKPGTLEQRYKARNEDSLAFIKDQCFWINVQGVIDCWDAYMPADVKRPGTKRVGEALKKIAFKRRRHGTRGSRSWYHVIQPSLVLELSQDMQVGNEDVIEANLGRGLRAIAGGLLPKDDDDDLTS